MTVFDAPILIGCSRRLYTVLIDHTIWLYNLLTLDGLSSYSGDCTMYGRLYRLGDGIPSLEHNMEHLGQFPVSPSSALPGITPGVPLSPRTPHCPLTHLLQTGTVS